MTRRYKTATGLAVTASLLLATLLVAGCNRGRPSAKPPGFAFHSVKVELPFGDTQFPGGASADVVNNNCLTCHSAEMVLTQPALSRTAWQAEVDKMRGAYKAPIRDGDVAAIVDYLAKAPWRTGAPS
jgi:cytochrome c5